MTRFSIPILDKKYKDHTVANPVNNIENENLPFNAHDVHVQPIRKLAITIQVLNEKTKEVVETITGKAESGSIRMDATSSTRRTGNLTMTVDPDLFPEPGSLMWFGNIIKVYAGLDDLTQVGQTKVNFLLGTFWIDEGSYGISENSNTLSFTLSDKMTKYDETELESPIRIPMNTPIHEAIKLVMEDVGETEFGRIEEMPREMTVPKKLEFGAGDKVIEIIHELRDMYMDCICGYNVDGQFEFRRVGVQHASDIPEAKWRFDTHANDRADLTLSFEESYRLKDIRNRLIVYGGKNEATGQTPSAEVRITDPKSPFNVDAIGERKKVMVESELQTDAQCSAWAKYHAWKMSNFNEKANITTVPIYMLDGNDVIEIKHPHKRENYLYMVDGFELGLGVESTMSISAHRIYFVTLEYGAKVALVANYFEKGIKNWGWLSLAEERIKAGYNISGSGRNTLTVRFVEDELGGVQASVTSYSTTKSQTLLVDLADFANLKPEDPSGDSGRSTGDYADRVLGHEMFHAVVNDYLGHAKSTQLPLWFDEGMAELVHGAKERFRATYPQMSLPAKKEAMIKRAEQLLDGAWTGDNADYTTGYMIVSAIYHLQSRAQWDDMFQRLKEQRTISINFLTKLLSFMNMEEPELKKLVLNKMREMNLWEKLSDPNEVDTGSIAGLYFLNFTGQALDADSVFNNSEATTDSIGFKIKIEK
ncbi:hypothetical protein B8A44_07825 [Dolosigranulum pigrum]|uniref:DUF5048 domain-containing protein n=1 Tax=Dolosigranulum pigrum TaxID=29394 RepID=A0A328KHS7_9LACT|nr:flagellin [Dolosigranulum pigrum]RAN62448.1 hypothetical protein B8A44_07825 [Dolosigranulum pigrum]